MQHEISILSHGEFAPPPPHDDRFRRELQRIVGAGKGVMAREENQNKLNNNNKGGNNNNAGPTTTTTFEQDDECSSPLVTWTSQQVHQMGYTTYKTLYENNILQMAYVYKHYVDNSHHDEYFVNTHQTSELQRRHDDAISFWTEADIDNTLNTQDVLLLSMHGHDLQDDSKLIPTILRIFDFDDMSDVTAFAAEVKTLIEALPSGYDNPILTMNAVATRSTYQRGSYGGHDDPNRRIKDSVILGDGVLQYLLESGLDSSGIDFVYAHEFGHHLQFQMEDAVLGTNVNYDDRKRELMADALGGYFLTHDMGGDMTSHEIGIFNQVAYGTGDCKMDSEDHHGTPKQRQCAAIWGASKANKAAAGGNGNVPVLDPEDFVRSFNDEYEGILRLKAGQCTLLLEEMNYYGGTALSPSDYSAQEEYEDEDDDIKWVTSMSEPTSIEEWLKEVEERNQSNERGSSSSSSSSSNYNDGDKGAGTNVADAGTPSETKETSMKHALTRLDCSLPWVYCPEEMSSSSASLESVRGGTSSFLGRFTYLTCATITTMLLILL